ncbi:MAG: hypothetical protein L0241_27130 [Planctomycetia bacterium]|nr:hypothetical protein [Planctomycetia bacterium]
MKRFTLFILGGLGLFLTPTVASAQFGLPAGAPVIVPSTNPFFYVPKYRYTYGANITAPTLFGQASIGYQRTYISTTNPALWQFVPVYPSWYSTGGSYMSGNPNVRNDLLKQVQLDMAKAQRDAGMGAGVRNQIANQWIYEKGGVVARPDPKFNPEQPDLIAKALAPVDPEQIGTGESLNDLLTAITTVEAKGAKGPSAFIPPSLLDDIRFGGSPAADTLNLVRKAGRLEFPSAFNDPALQKIRAELEKDFAAVASSVQAGKAPGSAKLTKWEATVQRAHDALTPIIKNSTFDDATAGRRFLNQMSNAVKVLKTASASTLIDPKWSAEGTTVADLVKHMNKHKLRFGPAPSGNEEAYLAMHRNLATYLFVLTHKK